MNANICRTHPEFLPGFQIVHIGRGRRNWFGLLDVLVDRHGKAFHRDREGSETVAGNVLIAAARGSRRRGEQCQVSRNPGELVLENLGASLQLCVAGANRHRGGNSKIARGRLERNFFLDALIFRRNLAIWIVHHLVGMRNTVIN